MADVNLRTPQNTHFLQPTKYLLTFDRLGDIQYFCQQVNVPGVNLGQAQISFPGQDVFSPGNKMTWNPLAIRFLVNEDLSSWRGLYNWFKAIASPEGTEERKRLTDLQNNYKTFTPRSNRLQNYSDATLTILSALNNPIMRIKFTNVFPITLNDLGLDTTQSADDIITADATFVFDYYEFEDLT